MASFRLHEFLIDVAKGGELMALKYFGCTGPKECLLTPKDSWVKIHGYLGANPLKTISSEKRTCNYFLTSIFLDLTIR
jgi:hypothetical protein